jgi:hypothetical protein
MSEHITNAKSDKSVDEQGESESTAASNQQQNAPRHEINPRPTDFLFGNYTGYSQHPGNQQFIDLVHTFLDKYNFASTETDKRLVIWEATKAIKSQGRFLRFEESSGSWIKADNEFTWAKTGQALQYFSAQQQQRLQESIRRAEERETQAAAAEASIPSARPEPLLSDREILAAIGYYLDEETGEYKQIEPQDRNHQHRESE